MTATHGSETYNYTTSGVYDNQGKAVDYIVDSGLAGSANYNIAVSLGATDDTDNGYTWIVDGTVGTLTVNNDFVFNSGLEITDVTDVIIETNGKLTIAGYGASSNSHDNLTVSGDLTITGDLVVTGYIWIDGDLTVNGNLVAGAVFAGSMEVPTGSTVNLLGAAFDSDGTYSDADKTYALRLSDATQEPTLTLGDNVSILTAGVTYAIGNTNISGTGDVNTGTFINDGETPDFNTLTWYNIASAVSIGKTPTTSTSRPSVTTPTTTTTTTETTTNDDGSVTVTVEPSTSTSSGTTSATVDADDITDAIESATEAADGESSNVEITVSTSSSTEKVEVTLESSSLSEIASSDVSDLTIKSDVGSVTISSDVAGEIADKTDGDVSISVGKTESGDIIVEIADEDGENIGISGLIVTVPHEIADDESAENVVVWAADEDGKLTEISATFDQETGELVFETNENFTTYSVGNNPFDDVSVSDYSFLATLWAIENGITNGVSDESFGSSEAGTREQVATFLWRLAGEPTHGGANPFSDVDADHYSYDAVLWAAENGITTGVSDDLFGHGEACTRAEIVTFLYRYAGQPEVETTSDFADVSADMWYANAVAWAVENGITNGTDSDSFSPDAECTRDQIVTFLYRSVQ